MAGKRLVKFTRKYYLEDLASGNPPQTQYGVTHDDFLQKGSEALQCNLASLFHFWGIHPSDSLASEIAQYPVCDGALERVVNYLDNAPRNNEELVAFYDEKMAVDQGQLKNQVYDTLLAEFDLAHGQQIRDRGNELLKTYFGIDADQVPSTPEVNVTEVSIASDTTDDVEFSWTEAVDPEGKTLDYSWTLKRSDNDQVLLSKTKITTNSVVISASEIKRIAEELAGDSNIQLIQQITTSDTFTIVQSEATPTTIKVNSDSSGSGGGDGGDNSGDDDSGGDNSGSNDNGSDNGGSAPVTPQPESKDNNDSSGGGSMAFLNLLLLLMVYRLFSLKTSN